MEGVVATFTAVPPSFIEVTNGIGYAYEISLINQGATDIVADSFVINMNFGQFGHPVPNSASLYSINGGPPENGFALAVPYVQTGFTTQVRIGFAANIPDAHKSLLAGQTLVVRLLAPTAYYDYVAPIESSIVVTAN